MPAWLKIGLAVLGGLILLCVLFFCFALWLIRVPKLETARNDPAAVEKLEDWFSSLHAHNFVPFNGTVLIRRGEDVLLTKAYGEDSLGRDLTPDSSLRLASVSKQFTAVGILTLVESGQVDLEAPISTYLSECDFNAPVQSLLDHTSGIPDVIYQRANKADILTLNRVEEIICDGSISQGNSKYAYSNTGYLLAARIIENVSGESFENYMQSNVFDPLGMKNSRVWNLVSTRPFPERAGGFSIQEDGRRALEPSNLDGVAGDGGVFSSINDLENWDRFWSDERLISKTLKDRALTPMTGNYGFGWVRDGDVVWHNGSWLGARTYISRNLKTGDLIVLLDNSSNVQLDTIGENLQRFLSE